MKQTLTKLKKLFFCVAIYFAATISIMAKSYYVSTTGNNANPGTLASPWRNINYAANYAGLVAGDTVFIRGGNYSERVKMAKSGSIEGRITIKNYQKELATIDGTGINIPSTEFAMFELRASYVTIDGLRVMNAVIFGGVKRDDGIWANRGGSQCIRVIGPNVKDVTIRNCYTHNCLSSGISVWGNSGKSNYTGATNILIENNEISNAVVNGWDEHITLAGGVDNFVVRNNLIYGGGHKGAIGIDAKVTCRNGKIYRNTVRNTISNGIYVDGWNDKCYNVDIYENTIYNVYTALAIGAEQGGTVYNINIFNNVVYDVTIAGVQVSGVGEGVANNVYDIKVYNNTIFSSGDAVMVYGTTKGLEIKNNIFSENEAVNGVFLLSSNIPNVVVDRNIVYVNKNRNNIPGMVEISGTNAITTNPQFVSTTAGAYNFKLQSTSPAINQANTTLVAATDFEGKARPIGGGYDIGAYEYGTAVSDEAKPSTPTELVSSNISQTGFTLSWKTSTDNVGVASYEVFRGNTSCGTTASTSLIISGLTANTVYAMTVKAKDVAGNVSATSNVLNVTTLPVVVSKYTLTVTSGTGSGSYASGTVVNIAANAAPAGKIFDKWTGATTGIASVTSATTTITMPSANAAITATYKNKLYTVTFKVTDGVKPLVGATVVYNNVTKKTDAAGQAVFTDMPYTTGVTYTITAAGFKKTVVSFDVLDNITKTIVLSSEEIALEDGKMIMLYPNPVKDILTIENIEEGTQISLYDISGTILYEKNSPSDLMTIELSNLASGIYIVKISSPTGMTFRKIMKE